MDPKQAERMQKEQEEQRGWGEIIIIKKNQDIAD